jgi:hypothetical protein
LARVGLLSQRDLRQIALSADAPDGVADLPRRSDNDIHVANIVCYGKAVNIRGCV